jgi:catalase
MIPHVLRLCCLAVAFGVIPSQAACAQDDPSPDEMVDAIQNVTGLHKGLRRNHGKGLCGVGAFKGDAEAATLTVSPLFSGVEAPVVFRFSLAGPDPAASDAARILRGMAVRITLPGGAVQDMAMLNAPMAAAANARSFYERLLASAPDPATGKPNPEKLKAYFATHSDSRPLADWIEAHNPSASFAETPYFSIHAFKFVGPDKQPHWVKWRFEPNDGSKSLTRKEMAAAPHDFLAKKLAKRLKTGPVQWKMIVTLGEPGDPIDNPSLPWPADRREIRAGTLTLTNAGEAAAGSCEDIMFDPNRLSPGIEPSPDPILGYRSRADAVSFGRRLKEKGR